MVATGWRSLTRRRPERGRSFPETEAAARKPKPSLQPDGYLAQAPGESHGATISSHNTKFCPAFLLGLGEDPGTQK